MSDTSRQREPKRDWKLFCAYWLEPRRRFYVCLIAFLICGFLEHASRWFFLGVGGMVFIHMLLALRMGNIYAWVLTAGLDSKGVIFQRNESAYLIAITLHFLFLSLFVYALLIPR